MSFQKIDEDEKTEGDGNLPVRRPVVEEPSVPYYTYLMTAGLVAVFLVQMQTGLVRSEEMAAFDKSAFRGGEYWRIMTASVMHGSIPHIFFNGYALFSFGRLVEQLSNKAHIPIIFLLSALSGSFLSLIVNPDIPSIGASGGIIGLLGYVAVYAVKRKQFLDPQFRKSVFMNIGFVALFGLVMFQRIDNFAHLGGILAGALYGFIQIPTDPERDPRTIGAVADGVGFVSLGIFVVTCLFTSFYLLDII